MQQTKGVGFLLRLAVDPLIAIEASFSASPIMNFEIKLFVLIIAMGKVKPNEVSDYQGEITNNNTSVTMYSTDKLIATQFQHLLWADSQDQGISERHLQLRISNLIYHHIPALLQTVTSFGLQSYYIHNYCHVMASKVRGLRVESNKLPQLILSSSLAAFVY